MELFIKQQPTASYVRFPCDKTKIQRFPWINEVIASRIFYSKFVVTNKRKSPVPIQKCVFGFDKEMFDLPTKECLRDLCFSED